MSVQSIPGSMQSLAGVSSSLIKPFESGKSIPDQSTFQEKVDDTVAQQEKNQQDLVAYENELHDLRERNRLAAEAVQAKSNESIQPTQKEYQSDEPAFDE